MVVGGCNRFRDFISRLERVSCGFPSKDINFHSGTYPMPPVDSYIPRAGHSMVGFLHDPADDAGALKKAFSNARDYTPVSGFRNVLKFTP
jgi:hypothetical protein